MGEDFAGTGFACGDGLLHEGRVDAVSRSTAVSGGWVWMYDLYGNSGPLPTDVSKSIEDHGLVAVSVLSGNRNFEGRISPEVRANYLMSPPLVVAYALAGHIAHNFDTDPLGPRQGRPPGVPEGHLADAG